MARRWSAAREQGWCRCRQRGAREGDVRRAPAVIWCPFRAPVCLCQCCCRSSPAVPSSSPAVAMSSSNGSGEKRRESQDEGDGREERKRKRKSRWGSNENDRVTGLGLLTCLPSDLTPEQEKICMRESKHLYCCHACSHTNVLAQCKWRSRRGAAGCAVVTWVSQRILKKGLLLCLSVLTPSLDVTLPRPDDHDRPSLDSSEQTGLLTHDHGIDFNFFSIPLASRRKAARFMLWTQ